LTRKEKQQQIKRERTRNTGKVKRIINMPRVVSQSSAERLRRVKNIKKLRFPSKVPFKKVLNQKAQNSEWTNARLFYSELLILSWLP
jgi:hypothetical protein